MLHTPCLPLTAGGIGDGTVNMTSLSPKMAARAALDYNAAYVALAHNHPAGLAIPSTEDVKSSYMVRAAIKAIGISMIDHFLVADGKCVPIIHSVEKGTEKEEALENYILKASEFEIEDDLEYDLLENICM